MSQIIQLHPGTLAPSIDKIIPDSGTSPVVPDSLGQISILGGLNIGRNAMLGAGSVVTKDIPENELRRYNLFYPTKLLLNVVTLLHSSCNTIIFPPYNDQVLLGKVNI